MTKIEKIQMNEAKVMGAANATQLSSKKWLLGEWTIERELGMSSGKPMYVAAAGGGYEGGLRIHVNSDLDKLVALLN